jgi:hypothetical protein
MLRFSLLQWFAIVAAAVCAGRMGLAWHELRKLRPEGGIPWQGLQPNPWLNAELYPDTATARKHIRAYQAAAVGFAIAWVVVFIGM